MSTNRFADINNYLFNIVIVSIKKYLSNIPYHPEGSCSITWLHGCSIIQTVCKDIKYMYLLHPLSAPCMHTTNNRSMWVKPLLTNNINIWIASTSFWPINVLACCILGINIHYEVTFLEDRIDILRYEGENRTCPQNLAAVRLTFQGQCWTEEIWEIKFQTNWWHHLITEIWTELNNEMSISGEVFVNSQYSINTAMTDVYLVVDYAWGMPFHIQWTPKRKICHIVDNAVSIV